MMSSMAATAWPSHTRREHQWSARMMLLMRIERWDARRDGPLSQTALQHKLDARGYEVSARSYPGGTVAAAQADLGERIQAVVTGLLKVTIDGESAILTAGDLVFIPRGAVRRIEVVGPSPAICLEGVARG
jgi:mannose-6-phosphate isomerase-like protein (cupin superfamily)